ncbi:MAG: murein L,D-transpeptidase catalytic domain family protein [Myxococcales bacterium]|nr:murein L,D-transpeptidase catalytic domain family protein [Myxococcales bacterium]
MSALLRAGTLAATLTIASVVSGCTASVADGDEVAGDEADESGGEQSLGKADSSSSDELLAARRALAAKFEQPALTDAEAEEVLGRYSHIDTGHEVPRVLLERALFYYDLNLELLENPRFVTVIDFSQHSSKRRLYLVDMESGELERHVVAHGSGSDPDDDGIPSSFSNLNNSHQSSLGFYLTAETYSGKWGLSLKLDGLSETNSDARPRAIVMHGASYVVDGKSKQGRSWGCPAIPMPDRDAVITQLKAGSLIYAERAEH